MFRTDVQSIPSYDVAVLGGGLAGLATALRLQAAGRSTVAAGRAATMIDALRT
jgi:anaerobic glycerol-3-phosphate dehydrogenase